MDRREEPTRERRDACSRATAASSTLVGSVGGLGRGERIYAVRFVGDVGYVVTFRQTDPLYTVDLSDPATARRRRAQAARLLRLPAPDRRRPAARRRPGRRASRAHARHAGVAVRRLRPAQPGAPSRARSARATSTAEYDHHAFLYWTPRLAVLPLTAHSYDDQTSAQFLGALGLRSPAAVDEPGRLTHLDEDVGASSNYAQGYPALARDRRRARHPVLRRAGVQPPGHAGAAVLRDVPAGRRSPAPDGRSRCRGRFRSRASGELVGAVAIAAPRRRARRAPRRVAGVSVSRRELEGAAADACARAASSLRASSRSGWL